MTWVDYTRACIALQCRWSQLSLRLAMLAVMSLPASAQMVPQMSRVACGATDTVRSLLAEVYGEAVTGRGVIGDSAIAEFWEDPNDGSWSVTVSTANGVTCIHAGGDGWGPVKVIKGKAL